MSMIETVEQLRDRLVPEGSKDLRGLREGTRLEAHKKINLQVPQDKLVVDY